MKSIPQDVSLSTKRRNPHLYQHINVVTGIAPNGDEVSIVTMKAKRIRQSTKPLLNQLEEDWYQHMVAHYYRTDWIFPQCVRLMLANGSWYKADFFVFAPSGIYAYECKGPKEGKNVAKGLLALKCAAHKYPKIQFMLVWKQGGKWQEQIVLP